MNTMNTKSRRSNSHQRRVEELRRSNIAVPHRNKKKYTRKSKYNKFED